jgi:hypothetical protein
VAAQFAASQEGLTQLHEGVSETFSIDYAVTLFESTEISTVVCMG